MDEIEKIQAILNRDSRYDDVFWYGVKSTGIVCKPSCSAKKAVTDHVKYV
ncbi:Ada metal-binding domain-containing protein [Bacteroides helcogenes]|nr:Ada metal-binding domain-containing protein [Bacteroides helcogenes]